MILGIPDLEIYDGHHDGGNDLAQLCGVPEVMPLFVSPTQHSWGGGVRVLPCPSICMSVRQ